MNQKEIIDLTKNHGASMADDRPWEDRRRIRAGEDTTSTYKNLKRTLIFRIIAFFCIGMIFLLAFMLNLFNPTVSDPDGNTGSNSALSRYYRYDGKYYKTEYPLIKCGTDPVSKAFVYIQNKIVKRLSGNFYEIAGIAPSQSIALFDGKVYYKLNYAFQDSVTFNGKHYLIEANNDPFLEKNRHVGSIDYYFMHPDTGINVLFVGEYLGRAGDFDAYAFSKFEPAERIAVKLNNKGDIYFTAYQLPSTVTLNGAAYEVQPHIYGFPDGYKSQYLGKAGPYDAYAFDASGSSKSIYLYISENKAAYATIISEPSGSAIPQSIYDSRFQSMDPISLFIKLDHKIYYVSSTFDYISEQEKLRDLIGDRIGSYSFDKASSVFEIYKVVEALNSRKKSIALKNNEIYVRYDYLSDTIVRFYSKNYEISFTGGIGEERGSQLGVVGSYEVYEVKGADPSKEILVTNQISSWTAYSVD